MMNSKNNIIYESVITAEEKKRVCNWLEGLGRGIYHNGSTIQEIGAFNINLVKYKWEEDYGSRRLYAIIGNCSLRLRNIKLNESKTV